MKHYASRNHSSTKAFIVLFLHILILFIVVFTDITISNLNKPAPQFTQEQEIENLNKIRELTIRQPRRFRNNGEQ